MTDHRRPPGFDPQRDVLLDAHNLRGLVHPLRAKILTMLRESGPATATMLAERLGESSAATSYHLRQLHRSVQRLSRSALRNGPRHSA